MTIPLLHDGLPATTATNINDAIAAASADAISQTYAIYNARVANYAALRGLTPVYPASVYLDGGSDIADGSQGVFYASPLGTTGQYVDNGATIGTIIVPTGGDGSVAWLRSGAIITHGTTAERPTNPYLWQVYGDDDLGIPIFAASISPSVVWKNFAGGVV